MEDSQQRRKSEKVRVPPRMNVADPVWHSYRSLRADEEPGDVLCFELWDLDRGRSDDLLARGRVECCLLRLSLQEEGEPLVQVPMKLCEGAESDWPCLLFVRMVKASSGRKRFFFIRHGLSKWNKAQSEANVIGLMDVDHPLEGRGIEQAQALCTAWKTVIESRDEEARREAEEFFAVPKIFSSPLTRALQTALLSCQGHPALVNKLHMMPSCREIKGIGGFDTMGKAAGEDIAVRARDELLEEMDVSEVEKVPRHISSNDCWILIFFR